MADENQRLTPDGGRMGYVPALDGIRAIAALGVLLAHYLVPVADARPLAAIRAGSLGVDVFFALSGFLITTLLVEEHYRRGRVDLRAFWARRALRLMPALVLVIASLVFLGALVDAGLLPYGPGLRAQPGGESQWVLLPFWPGIAVAFFPISNWVWVGGYLFSPLSFTWTLAIEDQFYLVWPLVLVLLLARSWSAPRALAVSIAALAAVVVLWRNFLIATGTPLLDVGLRTDTRADELLIGCAAGLAVAAGMVPTGPQARRLLGLLAWASLAGILALFVLAEPGDLRFRQAGATLVALLTVTLITHLIVDRGSTLSRVLSWPPLVGIGMVSYGLYLWHWIWLQYPVWTDAVRVPVAVALTSAAVLASYYLVERPALRLKHRFQRSGDSRPAGATAGGGNSSVSRRDLLPVLGMTSLAVAAAAAYGLAGRFYPKVTLASGAAAPEVAALPAPTPVPGLDAVSAVTPAPRLVAAPAATPVPRRTRLPRASQAKPEDTAPGRSPGTPRPNRARDRDAGKD